jgi:hypothetical protein
MGISYNPHIVSDGLVLCLDAANPRSYPGSGSTWYDLSGQGNNGALTNGPTFDSANGGSIVLDGVNDHVEKSTTTFLTGNLTATIDTWIYYTGTNGTGDYKTILSFGDGPAAGDTFSIGLYDNFRIAASFNAGNNVTTAQNTLSVNKWSNITITKTPGSANTTTKIYLNSILQSSSGSAITPNVLSRVIRIGRWTNDLYPYYPTMKISKASIYNKALSADEVRRNYNATKGRFGL